MPAGMEEITLRPVEDTGNILKQGYLEKRSRGEAWGVHRGWGGSVWAGCYSA